MRVTEKDFALLDFGKREPRHSDSEKGTPCSLCQYLGSKHHHVFRSKKQERSTCYNQQLPITVRMWTPISLHSAKVLRAGTSKIQSFGRYIIWEVWSSGPAQLLGRVRLPTQAARGPKAVLPWVPCLPHYWQRSSAGIGADFGWDCDNFHQDLAEVMHDILCNISVISPQISGRSGLPISPQAVKQDTLPLPNCNTILSSLNVCMLWEKIPII